MSLVVVKIGGGLLAVPGALDAACATVADAGRRRPVLVVPGGGPLADGVRALERRLPVSAEAAHWMAILAMDQYAYVLVERIPGAVIVDQPGAAVEMLRRPGAVVLAPSCWMRAANPLPHTWDVTSDSIAAFVAGALAAAHLILVKPVAGGRKLLDAYFPKAQPPGLAVTVVGGDRLSELGSLLQPCKPPPHPSAPTRPGAHPR